MAKALRQALKDRNMDLSHSDCPELIAKQFNIKDWKSLSAAIGQDGAEKPLSFSVFGEETKLLRTLERLDINETDLTFP